MRVFSFVDLRFTASKTPTGVGKHTVQMLRGLAQAPGVSVSTLATRDQLDPEGRIHADNRLSGFPVSAIPFGNSALEALWTVFGVPHADRWCPDADWVYCPKNDFVPLRKGRLAVTLHGAYWFDRALPRWSSRSYRLARLRWGRVYRQIVARADLLLSVSEFLKAQTVQWFGADPERIVVVGNGVEEEYFRAATEPRGISGRPAVKPYALSVGGLNYLDGASYTLEAAEVLARKLPELEILVAGRQNEEEYVRRAQSLANVRLLGYVPAPELAKLMRDAAALLYLTRYETFGIAAAEAMAVGTPVVASRSTAVPEVVGEAGFYVDPDDPEAVARAIVDLVSTESLRERHARLGRERADRFTWPACVERLLAALRAAS